MKKIMNLKGLDCANCAAKIEEGIQKVAGVKSASVSFFTSKLIVELEDENTEKTVENIKKRIHKIEPDVRVEET